MNSGTAANAIPDTATMEGSIRTFDESTREFIKQRLVEITENVARAFRTEAEVEFGSGCPSLLNNKDLSEKVLTYVRELTGKNGAFFTAELSAMSEGEGSSKMAGSEDFAYISQEVPSVMLALAAGEPDKGYIYPQHHPKVRFDEEALTKGSAVYAYTAMRWLSDRR
jgi:hippurate hydrolase